MGAVAGEKPRTRRRDLVPAFAALDTGGREPARGAMERSQRLLEVGDGADLDRIVAADLGRIDVDLDQARRREVERVRGLPRAAIGRSEEHTSEPQSPY